MSSLKLGADALSDAKNANGDEEGADAEEGEDAPLLRSGDLGLEDEEDSDGHEADIGYHITDFVGVEPHVAYDTMKVSVIAWISMGGRCSYHSPGSG